MANEAFRKNLINLMDAKHLLQIDVAKATGVTDSAVCMWRSGKMCPRGETLIRLAKVLGVTPSMLMEERGTFEQIDEERLLNDFRMLSPKGKEKALERMDELKQLYWYSRETVAK